MFKLESLNSDLFKTLDVREAALVHGGGPIVVRTYDVNPDGTLSGPTPDVVNVPDAPAPAPAPGVVA